MKSIQQILFIPILILLFSCEKETSIVNESDTMSVPILSRVEIQNAVEQSLKSGKVFNWSDQSNHMVYSAAMQSDSVLAIGYTLSKEFDIKANIHQVDIKSDEWLIVRQRVESLIVQLESEYQGRDVSIEDLEPYGKVEFFPQIIIQTGNPALIEALRNMDEVRFVEPLGFNISDHTIAQRSDSGCSGNPNYSINTADYTTVSPSSKVPWNFYLHNIDQAWTSSSKGDNVKVCIIDTGASDSQDNLGSQFNSGNSSGRTIQKYSTKYSGTWWWKSLDSPNDPCGHGTSMAGNAAAPWSNDGNALGVAYQSNLMTIRAVEDVIISTSNERNGVRDALYLAGNDGLKVISMSIGSPFYSSTVADGIYYAYNKGKLIMAAAGTSLDWTSWVGVIFPANMSQTVAVTGVKDGENVQKCATCHSGSEVDFIVVMERENDDDRTSLALARYSNQPKYIGGSSSATATAAGIATLVWGENPSASRYSVLNALKSASSYYPNRHSNFGWGKIDALAAVSNL